MAQGYFFYGHCTLITTGINKCCIYIENKKILADFFRFFNIFFCRLNLHSVFCFFFLNKYLFFVSSLYSLRLRVTQKALRQPFFFFLPSAVFGQTGKSCLCFSSIALGAGDQYRLISICHKLPCHVLQRSTVAMDLGQHVKCSSAVTKNISPPPIY